MLSIMQEDVLYIQYLRAHALFASLQLDYITTTDRLLGPTTCVPHLDGGIPLSALPKAGVYPEISNGGPQFQT